MEQKIKNVIVIILYMLGKKNRFKNDLEQRKEFWAGLRPRLDLGIPKCAVFEILAIHDFDKWKFVSIKINLFCTTLLTIPRCPSLVACWIRWRRRHQLHHRSRHGCWLTAVVVVRCCFAPGKSTWWISARPESLWGALDSRPSICL